MLTLIAADDRHVSFAYVIVFEISDTFLHYSGRIIRIGIVIEDIVNNLLFELPGGLICRLCSIEIYNMYRIVTVTVI